MPNLTAPLAPARRRRSFAAGIAVAIMAGAGLIAAPAAQAAAPGMLDTAASEACAVTDAELTWGFKEAFRSYISGTIANGEWTTADGATYATPDFSWTSGAGNYDGSSGEGLLGFTGSITFTGHGGILNTTEIGRAHV